MIAIFSKEYILKKWLRYNGLPADEETSAGFTDLSLIREEVLDNIETRYLRLLAEEPIEYLPWEDVAKDCRIESAGYGGWRIRLPREALRPVSVTVNGEEIEIGEFHPLEGPLCPALTLGVTGGIHTPTGYYSPKGIIEIYGIPKDSRPASVNVVKRPSDGTISIAPHLLPKLYKPDNEDR